MKPTKTPRSSAIVLRMDSPGGSALASDLIWNELNAARNRSSPACPTSAASGGYYIAWAPKRSTPSPAPSPARSASSAARLALGGLYDKVGLKTETLCRGKNAGILSSLEPFNDTEKKAMNALMQDVYDQFLDKVSENRAAAGQSSPASN